MLTREQYLDLCEKGLPIIVGAAEYRLKAKALDAQIRDVEDRIKNKYAATLKQMQLEIDQAVAGLIVSSDATWAIEKRWRSACTSFLTPLHETLTAARLQGEEWPDIPTPPNVSLRFVKTIESVDMSRVPATYLSLNEAAVKAAKDPVPGVTHGISVELTVRSK
jgi:hypothetical protein